jgi:hypothetical protein
MILIPVKLRKTQLQTKQLALPHKIYVPLLKLFCLLPYAASLLYWNINQCRWFTSYAVRTPLLLCTVCAVIKL